MILHCFVLPCALALLPIATAPSLSGLWSFEGDGTVVEFKSCGNAVCATVRRTSPKNDQATDNLKCGQIVMGGMKPERGAVHYRGWVLDPASHRRYNARIEPDTGALKLAVSAMGGLFSETYRLRPVVGAIESCQS